MPTAWCQSRALFELHRSPPLRSSAATEAAVFFAEAPAMEAGGVRSLATAPSVLRARRKGVSIAMVLVPLVGSRCFVVVVVDIDLNNHDIIIPCNLFKR